MATAKGATGDIKVYQIVLTTIGLFHLPLTWVCFQLGWEPYWAQIVYVIIIVILSVVRTAFVCKAIRIRQMYFYMNVVARSFAVLSLSSLLPLAIHFLMEDSFFRLVIVCVFSFLCSAISILYIGFSEKERERILQMVIKR